MSTSTRKKLFTADIILIALAWAGLVLSILIAACGRVPALIPPAELTVTPLPPAKSTNTPLPTLRPATDFVKGVNEVPAGKYLFVEYWRTWDGSGNCSGGAMIDFPGYDYSAGNLNAYVGVSASDLAPNTIGFVGDGDSNHGAIGGGISSALSVIATLPYLFDNQLGTLYSVYREGEIVVEIWGQTYWLAPGQSWIRQVEDNANPECHTVTTYRFTNYGFLAEDQIQLP